MVLTLFELSSHSIRNAVVAGEISNVSHLPLTLRRWIFELFRMKELLSDRKAVRLFEQSEFFEGFTTIDILTHDDDGYALTVTLNENRGFLVFLAKIFGAERHLAENIIELKLCCTERCACSPHCGEICRELQSIAKLLSTCTNLKRLQISVVKLNTFERSLVLRRISSICRSPLPALEDLAVICRWHFVDFSGTPKSWFKSLRSLKVHGFTVEPRTYSEILKCCQNTLTSLDVVFRSGSDASFSPVPINLPKLTRLSFESRSSKSGNFNEILQRCPGLTSAVFKINLRSISGAELTALALLSSRLLLHITVDRSSPMIADLVKIVGERLVELKCYRSVLTAGDYDQILANCRNLRSVEITAVDGESAAFLQKLFDDKSRAERLTELGLAGDFSLSMLQALFTNCCNLHRLILLGSNESMAIGHWLDIWVENGARPITLVLHCFDDICRDTVYSLMRSCGRNLKHIDVPMQANDENVAEISLNTMVNYCPMVEVLSLRYFALIHREKRVAWSKKYDPLCFSVSDFILGLQL